MLRANSTVTSQDSYDESQTEHRILDLFLRASGIDIPEQSERLTYGQAEELVRQQGEVVELVLPPPQLFDLVVQNYNANQAYLLEHVPDAFDGDMIIFAARSEDGNDSSQLQSWRPYVTGDITVYPVDCAHDDMMKTESLSMYGEQLKVSLKD